MGTTQMEGPLSEGMTHQICAGLLYKVNHMWKKWFFVRWEHIQTCHLQTCHLFKGNCGSSLNVICLPLVVLSVPLVSFSLIR